MSDCKRPTILLKYYKAGASFLLPPASLDLISLLLKRTEVKLQKTYSHREEQITPSDSSFSLSPADFLSWDCCSDRQNPLRLVLWRGIESTFLPSSLTRQNDSFSYYCDEPVKPTMQSMMGCKQWHFRANVFILENNAASWILRIIGKLDS